MSIRIELDVANFNIRATPKMLPLWIRHDLKIAKDSEADAFTWQELSKWRWYRRQVRKVFPRYEGWEHHFGRRNAITVDGNSIIVNDYVGHMLTKAVLWMPQPARFLDMLYCTDKRSGEDFDLASIHLTNGGYNGRKRSKRQRRERQKLWDKQFEEARKVIKDSIDAGRPVFIDGDFNRKNIPKLHSNQKIVVEQGIMKMLVILPDGWTLNVHDKTVIADRVLKTDHAGTLHRSTVSRRYARGGVIHGTE